MAVFEKLLKRISIINDANIVKIGNKLFLLDNNNQMEIVDYSEENITYSNIVYNPTRVDKYYETNYSVTFVLNQSTFALLSSNILIPPRTVSGVVSNITQLIKQDINKIIIGSKSTRYEEGNLYITVVDYETLKKIIYEEKKDKNYEIKRRFSIHLNETLNIDIIEEKEKTDYNLLIQEGLAIGEIDSDNARKIFDSSNNESTKSIIIDKQINKQAKWLIDTMQDIIDEEKISVPRAKELGNQYFGWAKSLIKGPEHLMEKILTTYGKNLIFGVPALLNTKKYVLNTNGLSRTQFDILLINYLSDLEVVELKRPDIRLLDYDNGRSKFYWNANMSIAIAQTERYLSTIMKDNDDAYKIDGKKVKDYINDNIGGVAVLNEVTRPNAIIIAGRIQDIAPQYKEEYGNIDDYNSNSIKAYKELSNGLKNIKIMTYTELLESVRLRETIENNEMQM